jgi:hypothetical protein
MKKTEFEETRKLLFEEVKRFLNCYKEIIIHQFGPTILYLPVYLLFDNLREGLNLKVSYENSKSNDLETVERVCNKDNDFLFEGNVLNIGLSEYEHFRRSKPELDKCHQIVFIERVPLWGVALANNAKINALKGQSMFQSDYWELFSSKFSLVDLSQIEDVRISVYPRGSTVYRIVEEAIGNTAFRSLVLAPLSEQVAEFDDLFCGAVDLSITIQPTYAVQRAIRERMKVEIVYNNLDPPKAFTSLFIRRFPEYEEKKNIILRKLLDYLSLLLEKEISGIYSTEFLEYKKLAEIYCDLILDQASDPDPKNCPISRIIGECKGKGSKDEDSCITASAVAIQILNDSRIYSHNWQSEEAEINGKSILDREIFSWEREQYINCLKTVNYLENASAYRDFFPYHFKNFPDEMEKYIQEAKMLDDPILRLGELASSKSLLQQRHQPNIEFVNNLPRPISLAAPENMEDFERIGLSCKELGIPLNDRIDNINERFRVTRQTLRQWFTPSTGVRIEFKFEAINKIFKRDETRILWWPHDINPFFHFVANMYLDREICILGKVLNIADDENSNKEKLELKLLVVLVQFKAEGYNPDKTKFVTNNPFALILNGWYLVYTDGMWKGYEKPVFSLPRHGNLNIETGNNLVHKEDLKAGGQHLSMISPECHYWVFTFKSFVTIEEEEYH